MAKHNFVILIGGPTTFHELDRDHDQSWSNFVVPMQVAARDRLMNRQTSEELTWLVHEPAYKERWDDDSQFTLFEKFIDRPFLEKKNRLHEERLAAARKVTAKGAADYLSRIRQITKEINANYVGLATKQDFWKHLESLPDGSISRIWYCGHATGSGFMLNLKYNPSKKSYDLYEHEFIKTTEMVDRLDTIKPKMSSALAMASEFYGCHTSHLAASWHRKLKLPAAGASGKIQFGVTNQPSDKTILRRLQTSKNDTGWIPYD